MLCNDNEPTLACPYIVCLKKKLEGFRYRVDDIKRAVTKVAVKEARLAEIKQEVSRSAK